MQQELKFNNKVGDLTLAINYEQNTPILEGLPLTIAQHKISRGKRQKADMQNSKVRLDICVAHNANQIPVLYDVKLTESWQEEEKIPIKTAAAAKPAPKEEKKDEEAPKEGEEKKEEKTEAAAEETQQEQQYETKVKNRERSSQVSFTTVSHAIPPDAKKRMKGLEEQMYIEDKELLDIKMAKYNLESYTYDMKNNCDSYGNYEHFIDPAIREQYMQTLRDTEEWIYGEGENAALSVQQQKLQDLKTIGEPIKARYRFRNEFEDWVSIFQKFKTKAETQLAAVPHLTDEQRESAAKSILDHE